MKAPYSTNFIDRHFLVTLVIIFSVLFVPLMLREWIALRAEGLYNVEWHTTSMASLLQKDLDSRHSLTKVLDQLNDPQVFDEFDQQVRQKIGYLGLLNVRIYTAAGEIVYALEKDLIGKVFLTTDEKKIALTGHVSSELIGPDEYFAEYSQEVHTDMAEVYVPIFAKDGKVPYILEAYYDYAPITLRTHSLLVESALSLLATTLAVLALLIYLYKGRQSLGTRIKALEAILPICMYCKKIRLEESDQPNQWMEIETYFAKQDDLAFSHGICHQCLQKHHPESKTAQENVRKDGLR